MKAFFYILTLLLGVAIYVNMTYLNNSMLRYFPKECQAVSVTNLDQLRRVRGVHTISSTMSRMVTEAFPEYKQLLSMFPISKIDKICTGEFTRANGVSETVTAVVLNTPLKELYEKYQQTLKTDKNKKSLITFEQDENDGRLFVTKIKDEIKEYSYVMSPTEILSFSPGLKDEMLKRINATFLESSVYSNETLEAIKSLETRKEIMWAVMEYKGDKNLDSVFFSVDSVNGYLSTEVNIGMKKEETADAIYRQAKSVEKTFEQSMSSSPYAKFFKGDWLKFDVHRGTFKMSFRFSENLLAKELTKLAKEFDKLSASDLKRLALQYQKAQTKMQEKAKK